MLNFIIFLSNLAESNNNSPTSWVQIVVSRDETLAAREDKHAHNFVPICEIVEANQRERESPRLDLEFKSVLTLQEKRSHSFK